MLAATMLDAAWPRMATDGLRAMLCGIPDDPVMPDTTPLPLI
jgi:hypothetical protein